jgi:outer membrane protein TolC
MNVVVIALTLALGQAQGQQQEQQQGGAPPAQEAQQTPPAQAKMPEHPALTLEDALSRAASENLDLRAANARLAQANTVSRQVWAAQLPQITASGRYTRNEEEAAIQLPVGFAVRGRTGAENEPPADPADLPGAPSPYFVIPSQIVDITIQELNQLNGSIDASQVLFAPALWLAIRNSYRTENVAALNVEAARRDILFGVAQSYYAVASLRQALDVAERLLEIAQRQERDARVRFQAGTIAKVGLLRAEIDRARAEQDVRRAANQYESAKVGLATLLNRDTAFEVVDPPEPQLGGTVEELEARAVQDRPELRAAGLNVDIARNERRQLAADYLPTVAAFGTYQISSVGGFTGQSDFWAAGLALSWNIFDGGLREARISEAGARITEFEATRASSLNNVRTEVRQAWLDHESARANAAKAREQRELAAENLRLVDVSYRAGAATAVEQADATAQLRNAEIAVTTEELQAQLAALRVLRAAGEFEPLKRK